jgi:hypothetical protein
MAFVLTPAAVRAGEMRAVLSCTCGNGTLLDLSGLPDDADLTRLKFRCRCGRKGRLTVETIGKRGGTYGIVWRG